VSVYVYAVTAAATAVPRSLRGIGDPPARLRKLTAGPLAAVVSAAPDRVRARRRDLQAHQDVLLALAGVGPVLPTRFGLLATEEEDVLAQLRAAPDPYAAALETVAGHVEMNLKASPVEAGLPALVREDPQVRRLREESRSRPSYDASIRLGEAVVAGLRRRAATAAGDAVAALTALAARAEPGPQVPGCVLNVSFLLPAARVADCRAAVDEVAERVGDRAALRLTGPLPCYSFCSLPALTGV
jgi:hypothetical protein